MHVLFVAAEPPPSATYRYRSENIAAALHRSGHTTEVVHVGQSRVRVRGDVVVLHRISAVPEGVAFARAARDAGAALVYSTDDAVFDADAFPPGGEPWARIRWFAPLHAAMLCEADAVLVSTDYLAREATRLFGKVKSVFTVRNFLAPALLALSERAAKEKQPADTVTFGYFSGTATHASDFALVAEPLAELLYAREKARLLVVGHLALGGALKRLQEHGKVTQIPFVPHARLPGLLASVDINLAPLDLRYSFARGKSEIKFLEAAAAGVPTIATRADGFAEGAPESACAYFGDETAVSDDLARIFDDAPRRSALADAAYAYVLRAGTEEAHAEHTAETFARIGALPTKSRREDARADGVWVNFPFAPMKYVVKGVQRRLGM